MRLVKIIATLGPATQNQEMICNLLKAGVNVFRLNFSHAAHEGLKQTIEQIRRISRELDLSVAILGDLRGPKFRIGELKEHSPIQLEVGATIRFAADEAPGDQSRITTNAPQIIEELRIGDEVLLNDGAIALQVIERLSASELNCKVIIGGTLGEKKGINVPGLKVANLPALTGKDKEDALFALGQDLDYLALSFVRSARDILELRRFLQEHATSGQAIPLIVAKIEKPQALEEIDAILDVTDAVMIARGDLGVELKPERVPAVQKMLIHKANKAEKPVITATQMMESMIQNPMPTRAEVSDIANAVFDGTDALMLSAETAVGKYPVEAVQIMGRIVQESESHCKGWHQRIGMEEFMAEVSDEKALEFHQAIALGACYAAIKAKTRAIIALSHSGKMANRISKRKPQQPIIALTPNPRVCRQMNLLWGVYPLQIAASDTAEGTLQAAEQAIFRYGYLRKDDPVAFCAGQTHLEGMTNMIKIYSFGDILAQHQ